MQIELLINNSADPKARYLCWGLSPCKIRLSDPTGATSPVSVTLQNKPGGTGGTVVFRSTQSGASKATLNRTLPLDGSSVAFFAAGKFGSPSTADGDAVIQVRAGNSVLVELPVMVRIRKNADTLTPAERDRFIAAFAKLNNQGTGRFVDFPNMHKEGGLDEAHGAAAFLPWHRAYLLDLERELQAIDPSVSLPYWRFDQPAPFLFAREFLGVASNLGRVEFSANNPLQFWRTNGVQGIIRRPRFDPATEGANNIKNESQTLSLGTRFREFRNMEADPHNPTHGAFGGLISSPDTAPRDPLFFLLHCNVDRLWAKWQRKNKSRFDPAKPLAFDSNPGNRIGHNLGDTMWPWNGVTVAPRPQTAPGGALAGSPCVTAPGPQPMVRDSLDYQGTVSATSRLGFDYDDVSLG